MRVAKAATILALVAASVVLLAFEEPGAPVYPSVPAQYRAQRDAYWASKLGRQFGVPEGAYAAALTHAAASQARIKAAGPRVKAASLPAWTFIGPQP
ncbi:MAG TPA: hypothetical protein VEF03_09070, partial [Candidatus Binataceae bacterium]|nr:hypothetical protein [Candidatus Binataceae bacterium]